MDSTDSKNLVMKLGADGFIAYMREQTGNIVRKQHFPALGDATISGLMVVADETTGLAKKIQPIIFDAHNPKILFSFVGFMQFIHKVDFCGGKDFQKKSTLTNLNLKKRNREPLGTFLYTEIHFS